MAAAKFLHELEKGFCISGRDRMRRRHRAKEGRRFGRFFHFPHRSGYCKGQGMLVCGGGEGCRGLGQEDFNGAGVVPWSSGRATDRQRDTPPAGKRGVVRREGEQGEILVASDAGHRGSGMLGAGSGKEAVERDFDGREATSRRGRESNSKPAENALGRGERRHCVREIGIGEGERNAGGEIPAHLIA